MMNYSSAIEDFRRAHRPAVLKDIIERLRGSSSRLLSFDEVRHSLKAQDASERDLMEIPLNSIIGSVNRYSDFTRDFMTKDNLQEER